MRSFVLLYVDRVEVQAYKNKSSDWSILYKSHNEICIKPVLKSFNNCYVSCVFLKFGFVYTRICQSKAFRRTEEA